MDNKLWILAYSKFSPSCRTLMNHIEQANLNIQFNLLCIDGKEMRKRVSSDDNKIKITCVPCIICVEQSSGIANQYEGDKAFELIFRMIESSKPVAPEPQIVFKQFDQSSGNLHTPMVPVKLEQQHQQQQHVTMSTSTPIESLIEEDEPYEEEEEQIPVIKQHKSGKISVSSVLAASKNTDQQPQRGHHQISESPKQTGAKISVAEIMSGRG